MGFSFGSGRIGALSVPKKGENKGARRADPQVNYKSFKIKCKFI